MYNTFHFNPIKRKNNKCSTQCVVRGKKSNQEVKNTFIGKKMYSKNLYDEMTYTWASNVTLMVKMAETRWNLRRMETGQYCLYIHPVWVSVATSVESVYLSRRSSCWSICRQALNLWQVLAPGGVSSIQVCCAFFSFCCAHMWLQFSELPHSGV